MQPHSINQMLKLPCGVTVKNRFFKSAMSESMADKNNNPTSKHRRLYLEWAKGGSAITVTGNVMVDRNALGEPKNVVLDEKSDLYAFKSWAEAGTKNNTELWMQLNHPGKQSPKMLSKHPVAPSAVALSGGFSKFFNTPRALEEDEIHRIVEQFKTSAKLAKEAGFRGIQIHAAHGYLISQFLSPHDNRRNDAYGGSIENRMRFLIQVYQAIRNVVGKRFPIAIKINAEDFRKNGLTNDDSFKVIKRMASLGVDLIEVSGGNYETPVMSTGPTHEENSVFFLDFAKTLKAQIEIPFVITGGFRTLETMENAIQSGETSMIGIARPLALYPDAPNRFIAGKDDYITIRRLKTGLKTLDKRFGPIIGNTYYETQMQRIAKGKQPKIHRNGWRPLIRTILTMGPSALRKRRS